MPLGHIRQDLEDPCESSHAQLARWHVRAEHRSCGTALWRDTATTAAAPGGRLHLTTQARRKLVDDETMTLENSENWGAYSRP